jgi:hypothetical protein
MSFHLLACQTSIQGPGGMHLGQPLNDGYIRGLVNGMILFNKVHPTLHSAFQPLQAYNIAFTQHGYPIFNHFQSLL